MRGVKICGLTRHADARLAVELGAAALGVVFAASPRQVTPSQARRILAGLDRVARVGVFVDAPLAFMREAVEEAHLDCVQLAGAENAATACALRELVGVRVIRAVTLEQACGSDLEAYPADAILVDTPTRSGAIGGTGMAWDWSRAATLDLPSDRLVIAGGLHARNVARAIRTVRPAGVDVCSGVESAPGVKDPARLALFMSAALEGLSARGVA